MIVFYSLNRIVSFAFLSDSANAAGIAVIHSLFNIGCCIILYPFSNLLVKLATIVIPDGIEEKEEQDDKEMLALDDRFWKVLLLLWRYVEMRQGRWLLKPWMRLRSYLKWPMNMTRKKQLRFINLRKK